MNWLFVGFFLLLCIFIILFLARKRKKQTLVPTQQGGKFSLDLLMLLPAGSLVTIKQYLKLGQSLHLEFIHCDYAYNAQSEFYCLDLQDTQKRQKYQIYILLTTGHPIQIWISSQNDLISDTPMTQFPITPQWVDQEDVFQLSYYGRFQGHMDGKSGLEQVAIYEDHSFSTIVFLKKGEKIFPMKAKQMLMEQIQWNDPRIFQY